MGVFGMKNMGIVEEDLGMVARIAAASIEVGHWEEGSAVEVEMVVDSLLAEDPVVAAVAS
jgi:hypothetical protein